MFISNCPLLQQLKLLDCNFGEVSRLNIVAPNLQAFYYVGYKLFICFVSAPLLDEMLLHERFCEGTGVRRRNFDILKKLHLDDFRNVVPALRNLVVDDFFLKILEIRHLSGQPSQPPNCLQQLTDLDVYNISLSDLEDVSSLLRLIRRSPNLERFSAEICQCDIEGHVHIGLFKILEPDQYDFSCNRLETVVLLDFDGTDPEMEFVQFLLSKSPQLKTMTIHQASKDDKKRMQILRKMIMFQRASAVVEINYCDPEAAPNIVLECYFY